MSLCLGISTACHLGRSSLLLTAAFILQTYADIPPPNGFHQWDRISYQYGQEKVGNELSALDLVCLGGIVMASWQFAMKTQRVPEVSERATLKDILVEVGLQDSLKCEEGVADLLCEQLVVLSGLSGKPSLEQVVDTLSIDLAALEEGLVKHGVQRKQAKMLCKKIKELSEREALAERRPARFGAMTPMLVIKGSCGGAICLSLLIGLVILIVHLVE